MKYKPDWFQFFFLIIHCLWFGNIKKAKRPENVGWSFGSFCSKVREKKNLRYSMGEDLRYKMSTCEIIFIYLKTN